MVPVAATTLVEFKIGSRTHTVWILIVDPCSWPLAQPDVLRTFMYQRVLRTCSSKEDQRQDSEERQASEQGSRESMESKPRERNEEDFMDSQGVRTEIHQPNMHHIVNQEPVLP